MDEECTPAAVAKRLREVVKTAGGHGAVAARSGIPKSSLTRLLSGKEIKHRALVALADACGVSVGWLATGREATQETPHPAPAAEPWWLPTGRLGPGLPIERLRLRLNRVVRLIEAINDNDQLLASTQLEQWSEFLSSDAKFVGAAARAVAADPQAMPAVLVELQLSSALLDDTGIASLLSLARYFEGAWHLVRAMQIELLACAELAREVEAGLGIPEPFDYAAKLRAAQERTRA